MINPKFVCISAAVGFVLSCIIGLFAGIGFFHAVLRAVIFAAVFALIAVAAIYLYSKFLSDVQTDSAPCATSDADETKTQKTGGLVDITLDEGSLPDDEQGPQFYVGNNRAALGSEDLTDKSVKREKSEDFAEKTDEVRHHDVRLHATDQNVTAVSSAGENRQNEGIESIDPADAVPADDKSFVPVDFSQAPKVTESVSAVQIDDNMNGKEDSNQGEKEENLDDLPDIGELDPDNKKSSNDDIISDSDFASTGSSEGKSVNFPSGKNAKEQNTAVMAQAIKTLLAKDKGN